MLHGFGVINKLDVAIMNRFCHQKVKDDKALAFSYRFFASLCGRAAQSSQIRISLKYPIFRLGHLPLNDLESCTLLYMEVAAIIRNAIFSTAAPDLSNKATKSGAEQIWLPSDYLFNTRFP